MVDSEIVCDFVDDGVDIFGPIVGQDFVWDSVSTTVALRVINPMDGGIYKYRLVIIIISFSVREPDEQRELACQLYSV